MALRRVFNKYSIVALIVIAILALEGLYKIDILEIITNKYIFIFFEVVFAMLLVAFLLYAFILLIEKFNRDSVS